MESVSNNIIEKILDALDIEIFDLLERYETFYLKQYNRNMRPFERKLTRLYIIHDMVRSIERYTKPDDTLIAINSNRSNKNNLEIHATIKRNDEVYYLDTEVIYAGGYNIQKLHYRYITRTNLPQTFNREISDLYSNEIKKLTKLEKLNSRAIELETQIKQLEELVLANSVKPDDVIFKEIEDDPKPYMYHKSPTWDEVVARGADKNYKSKEDYDKETEEFKQYKIEFWKSRNIRWKDEDKRAKQKELASITKKINSLI